MKVIFSDVAPISLMRFSSFKQHYSPPPSPTSPTVMATSNKALYIPSTFGFLKYTQTSMVRYRDTAQYPAEHYFFSMELRPVEGDKNDFQKIADTIIPLSLNVVGVCILPVVMPMDSKTTYTVQFLIVEDPFPLGGPDTKDVDMVIDIDGLACGSFWPHERGVVPVIERGKPKIHLNSNRICELLAVGVCKELNTDTGKGKVGVTVWFGRDSVYNHSSTVEVDFNDNQYYWLRDEDTVQMIAVTYALEKLAAMFLETAVIAAGVRVAVPSHEVVRIVMEIEKQRIVPTKKGWSWLAVMEFLRRLQYKMEAEYLDLKKWEQLDEIVELARKGEKKVDPTRVYSPAEIWAYSDAAEKRGCRWVGYKEQAGTLLLKEIEEAEALNRWDESRKKGVYEIRESDWMVRGWPSFLDTARCRRMAPHAVPRVNENQALI
ncbi:hypothetical protein ABW19_dt0201032 [Dactylella cylindrospora]|nr:hypothetical protein ABW19_dt0201032 [Dactylella cylindrospora]